MRTKDLKIGIVVGATVAGIAGAIAVYQGMVNNEFGIALIVSILALVVTSFMSGMQTEKDESKNFTVKEVKTEPTPRPRPEAPKMEEVKEEVKAAEPYPQGKAQAEEIVKQAPATLQKAEVTHKQALRGEGAYNKLVAKMRFEGFETIYFPASGYNSKPDYITPIKNNPDKKYAVIIDELQKNPAVAEEVEKALAPFDSDNIRLYTITLEA